MASQYVDLTAIIQVIGNVYKNPSLLDSTDQYTITEEDFPDQFHQIVFGSIYKLYELGAKQITLTNIADYLSTRPKSEAIYKTQKGEEWLLKAAESAIPDSFNYYYGRLKKFSLLRAYDNFGIDVTDIFDPNNILDTKKRQLQEDVLDNSSLTQIADLVDAKIDNIKIKYIDNCYEEAEQAGDGILELIESFKFHPEVGVPLYGPFVNTVTRGARLKKFYLRSAPTGIGKAIPNYTIIPTPQGSKRVDEIRVGDYLFGQDGKPTKVIGVHPQADKKEIWNVVFSDGRIAECCKDHLWEYRYDSHRGFAYRVETTEELYNRSLKMKNNFKQADGKGFRFHIKLNEPVEYPEKQFTIHPYIMGALLGDGSFRYSSTNKALSFSFGNDELPNKIASLLGNYIAVKSSENNYNYTFKPVDNMKHNLWVEELFYSYPELWQLKSEDKFIPKDYLEGSIKQRYELLQGLMDTDGTIDAEKGRTSFSTISSTLKDDFINLCHSLGFITSVIIDNRKDKYTTGECYTIHIQCKKENKHDLFSLTKKVQRALNYENNAKRSEYKNHLAIVNIYKTEQKADMTCFTVDNNDHLFLMNDYIVTHNTRSMIADACYIGCNKIYDELLGWVKTGPAQPTLYITTEQTKDEIQTMMLAFLSNVNEDHIINGWYEGNEEERVKEAANILLHSPLYIDELPDFSLLDIENHIKKNLREHGVKYVFEDYLHTSMKILEEIQRRSGGIKLREDNILFMLSNKLKDLCNTYGIFIMSATQLNAEYQESETPDQNLLRGAKSIADKIDWGSILLPVKQKDLEKLDPILGRTAFPKPVIKMSIYKNRRGKYKGIYLWCKADLGCCRIEPIFATDWGYELIQMDDIKITLEDEESAF